MAEKKKRLAPPTTGTSGIRNEWYPELPKAEKAHGHLSPLIGIPFGIKSGSIGADKLYDAGKAFFEEKLANGCGHIGWSCAWIMCLKALFGEAESALYYLRQQLSHSVYPNLFNTHPIYTKDGKPGSVFQIDGNFGAVYGIARMLLGDGDCITFLPALPEEWKTGSISGLRASGGFECALKWENGILNEAAICSLCVSTFKVAYNRLFTVTNQDGKSLSAFVPYSEIATE